MAHVDVCGEASVAGLLEEGAAENGVASARVGIAGPGVGVHDRGVPVGVVVVAVPVPAPVGVGLTDEVRGGGSQSESSFEHYKFLFMITEISECLFKYALRNSGWNLIGK